MRKAADKGGAVERFEFVEFAAVDDTRNHLPDIVDPARVYRNDAVDLVGIVKRLFGFLSLHAEALGTMEISDDGPDQPHGVGIVLGDMIDHAGKPRMRIGAAELFGGHHFAGI